MHKPVVASTNRVFSAGWYFWDETWTSLIGASIAGDHVKPFASGDDAARACRAYVEGL